MSTKKNTRVYSDFDLDFQPHPLTGDVSMKYNEEAVKRSIRNIVLYNAYEKPFMPEFGTNLRDMLFENVQTSTAMGIETRIQYMLKSAEPRCNIIKIEAVPDEINSQYEVIIEFNVVNLLEPITTTIYLQRIR
jgi:phage baseplate assembly protein W